MPASLLIGEGLVGFMGGTPLPMEGSRSYMIINKLSINITSTPQPRIHARGGQRDGDSLDFHEVAAGHLAVQLYIHTLFGLLGSVS
jgi:hypothetical protein